jgi:hypothetical protein
MGCPAQSNATQTRRVLPDPNPNARGTQKLSGSACGGSVCMSTAHLISGPYGALAVDLTFSSDEDAGVGRDRTCGDGRRRPACGLRAPHCSGRLRPRGHVRQHTQPTQECADSASSHTAPRSPTLVRRHTAGRERMGSPTLQTHQDPILLLGFGVRGGFPNPI